MLFHQIGALLSDDMVGKRVCLRGWIYRRSVVGGKAFVRVRDSTGVVQVVVDEAVLGEELVKTLKDIGLEASVEACGTVMKQPRAPTGYEVMADYFRILGYSRDFPI
ncbi:MAG: OB-fold nucleic acid binding domain-containing protein, partial [Thermogladius sp.]